MLKKTDRSPLWGDYFSYLESQGHAHLVLSTCRQYEGVIKSLNNDLLLHWAEYEELNNASDSAREIYKFSLATEGGGTFFFSKQLPWTTTFRDRQLFKKPGEMGVIREESEEFNWEYSIVVRQSVKQSQFEEWCQAMGDEWVEFILSFTW